MKLHMIKHLLLKIVLIFGLLLAAGCQVAEKTDAENSEKEEEKKEEAVPVEVAEVARGRIEAIIQATANLEAEESVKIYGRTTNPVKQLLVEEGDQVEKDQVLLRLINDTQTIQVQKAETELEKAQKDFDRQKDLYEKDLITQQAYTDADFNLTQAKLRLDESRQDLAYTEVRAPISGTITERLVKLGDMVNINQHLFDIVDFESLVARVYLPEKNLVSLQVGLPSRIGVKALGDQAFPGEVLRIAPTVDAGTGTVKVTIKVNETGPLRPGMFVDVALVLDVHEDSLLIPKRALVYDSDQIFIFRIKENEAGEERVERVLLQPVLQDKDNVKPGPEISPGDRIVIAGQTGLKDHALVKVLNSGTADQAAVETSESNGLETAEVQTQ